MSNAHSPVDLREIPLPSALAFRHGMGVDPVFAAIPISEALITL
jgi:hypothetical protein